MNLSKVPTGKLLDEIKRRSLSGVVYLFMHDSTQECLYYGDPYTCIGLAETANALIRKDLMDRLGNPDNAVAK